LHHKLHEAKSGVLLSKISQKNKQVTITSLQQRKESGGKISMVTCYDSTFAKIIDRSEIDMILVGDSLGNVMLGYDNTISVTMNDMIHHTAAVSRVINRVFLCADMPFMSYQVSKEDAVRNAGRLVQEAGAHAVKLEGGKAVYSKVSAIVEAGIPVMGHLGLTPQSIHQIGGYRVQGRGPEARRALIEDAKGLEQAGAFAIVLEMVPVEVADEITKAISIPTIGIGAGASCGGQVLVLQDLLGFDQDFNPKFLKKYLQLGPMIQHALGDYHSDVLSGQFPAAEHSYTDVK
jgi:3-methyl-2-oxobutanoate hydroxymethyltransferase